VDVVLERAGTITGRVFDEFGEPMADARVEALLVVDNRPLPVGGRSRETDDEGRFRLFDLQSSKYVLRAEPPGSVPAMTPAGHDALAYTPAFAPGVPDAASAQVVVVGTTRDATGIDIRLSKQGTYRVSGTVLDSRGQPLRHGFVNYSRATCRLSQETNAPRRCAMCHLGARTRQSSRRFPSRWQSWFSEFQ
jgi:Carboxypeptidase regulatory-like domain